MHACSFVCGLKEDVLICTNLLKNIYYKCEVASLSAWKSLCCGLRLNGLNTLKRSQSTGILVFWAWLSCSVLAIQITSNMLKHLESLKMCLKMKMQDARQLERTETAWNCRCADGKKRRKKPPLTGRLSAEKTSSEAVCADGRRRRRRLYWLMAISAQERVLCVTLNSSSGIGCVNFSASESQ